MPNVKAVKVVFSEQDWDALLAAQARQSQVERRPVSMAETVRTIVRAELVGEGLLR